MENQALLASHGGRNKNLPSTLTLDHVSPATRLLEKRRQMFEVQEALDAQKEEFLRREDAFRRREESLRKKDLDLQESLIKFNKFVQENESKRNRAIKRATDEMRQREQKEKEVSRLKEEFEKKKEEEQALKRQLQINEKYQEYLSGVIEDGGGRDDYTDIGDLLSRHNTLKQSNEELAELQRQHEQDHEDRRLELGIFGKTKRNEILNQNNDIAKLQKIHEGKTSRVTGLQNDVEAHLSGTSEKTMELGKVLRSVQNIHDRLFKHTRGESRTTLDLEADRAADEQEHWRKIESQAVTLLKNIQEKLIEKDDICREAHGGKLREWLESHGRLEKRDEEKE